MKSGFAVLSFFLLLCIPAFAQPQRTKTVSRAQLDTILSHTLDAQNICDLVKYPSGLYPGTADRLVPAESFTRQEPPCSIAARWNDDIRTGRTWQRYQKMLLQIARLKPAMLIDAATMWGTWEMTEHLHRCRYLVADLKKISPEMVVMATPNEWVNEGIVRWRNIPQYVWDAFGLPNQNRPFDCNKMRDDMTEELRNNGFAAQMKHLESQMYYYWLSTMYIAMGCEAISFSATSANGSLDGLPAEWTRLVHLVRRYADTCPQVRFVLVTGHSATGFSDTSGRLLYDFHIEPLRPTEDPKNKVYPPGPNGGACVVDAVKSCPTIYGNGLGGINPNGWFCERNPGLVFFDNYQWANEDDPASEVHFFGQPHKVARRQQWNCWSPYFLDEISWFALQTKAYRDSFLRYADARVRALDPALYFAPPIKRTVAAGLNKYREYTCDGGDHYWNKGWWPADYFALDPDEEGLFQEPPRVGNYFFAPPDRTRLPLYGGYGQEKVIKEILERR